MTDMLPNEKLIRAKQRWAEDGRLLTGTTADPDTARLPPGQRLVSDWPVLDLGNQPRIDATGFRLDIDGAVRRPLRLTLDGFMALPMRDSVSDIHCVTQWSRYDNRWQGVPARAVMDMVEVSDKARHVVFHAVDGYTTNVPRDQFAADDVFLVHSWNDRPLTREHGGPVRVLIPRLYLWKSAKWIRRIEFTIPDRPGFWEQRGYHNTADPWQEQRYS